jgi:hypothetical protein
MAKPRIVGSTPPTQSMDQPKGMQFQQHIQSPQSVPSGTVSGRKCPNCGIVVGDEAEKCWQCKASLTKRGRADMPKGEWIAVAVLSVVLFLAFDNNPHLRLRAGRWCSSQNTMGDDRPADHRERLSGPVGSAAGVHYDIHSRFNQENPRPPIAAWRFRSGSARVVNRWIRPAHRGGTTGDALKWHVRPGLRFGRHDNCGGVDFSDRFQGALGQEEEMDIHTITSKGLCLTAQSSRHEGAKWCVKFEF